MNLPGATKRDSRGYYRLAFFIPQSHSAGCWQTLRQCLHEQWRPAETLLQIRGPDVGPLSLSRQMFRYGHKQPW